MYKFFFLAPVNHKGMNNEKNDLGRSTERYLNTNGRWSGFPPKKNNTLLVWDSKEDAQQAIAIAETYGRKMNLCYVEFSNSKLLDRIILFSNDYAFCLKGYI